MAKTKVKKLPHNYLDKPVKTNDILRSLDFKYNENNSYKGEWVGFAEFRPGTGYEECSNRYIDFWAINCFGSHGYTKISYEIKQSRTDFMHEITNAPKRKMALLISNQYYFAAPYGLIKPEELPPEAGLVEFWWTNNQDDVEKSEKILDLLAVYWETKENSKELEDLLKSEDYYWSHYKIQDVLTKKTPYKPTNYKEEVVSRVTVKAPIREHMVPGWKFIAAVCRRTKDEIANIRKSIDNG